MRKEQIKEKIDQLINELIEILKKELSHCLESVTLTGSYPIGKISLDRPNVNILIFVKPSVSANDYLKIGEVFYKSSEKYKDYFGIKIDSLPFRYGIPTGKEGLQLVLTPNVLNMAEKDQKPSFGIPHNVLEGMKATRKVVFGSDPLSEVDLTYTRKDLIQWAFFDVGVLFRNLLIRAPLSYDVGEHLDLLAHESLELGKVGLYWGAEIFMSEKDMKEGKHIELIKDKEKMIDFYQSTDKELGDSARAILETRELFQKYKRDKNKIFKLYNASYTVIYKVFFKILSEMRQ